MGRSGYAAILVSALLLSACGTAATGSAAPIQPPSVPSLSTSNPPIGPVAAVSPILDFQGTTVEGASFRGATLAGRPSVFWFWAPWCAVCRAEAPDVAAVASRFQGRVSFVGIAGLGGPSAMRSFVRETGTGGFPHLTDLDGTLWSHFGVTVQPSFVFVTAGGKWQEVTGSLSGSDLARVAVQLLAAG
jgi:thiol-disulfide isomerase/thioredoxin